MGRLPEELYAIARIVGAQGNKGEVRAIPLTDFSERFVSLREAFLSMPSRPAAPVEVERARFKGNLVILKLKGTETIEQALALRDGMIHVSAARRVGLPPGRYFHSDLLGMRVEREDGSLVGFLREIWSGKANDVFLVRGAAAPATGGRAGEEARDGENAAAPLSRPENGGGTPVRAERELLLPAVREVVREVDVPGKRMVVRLLPGMEDQS